ncbi:2-oxo acid dehydrogenase subunit E2 [Christensenellaceae bacterium OttesenSCG-928-K19]|nr:2-oxo acid dehydrogenase subunit E2 [Christensenellaceae bacterium OttesenSCG-928-K19]
MTNIGTYTDIPFTNIRTIIANNMQNSLQSMAQVTNTASFDATNILAQRKANKQETNKKADITINDMILYAVSRTLKNFGDLNAHCLDKTIRQFDQVNLGMAVDTPRGLLAVTIYGADQLTLAGLSNEAKRLVVLAKEGRIMPDYLSGATFTVSNLGVFGTESFTPIINAPQTGLLGVNTIKTNIKLVDGAIVPYQAIALSLTYDHRAVDGAPAARFLQELCQSLEKFEE